MTVYLLLSDKEPPFELLRRRLSSCAKKNFVVVLSQKLPVEVVLQKAGLDVAGALTGFEMMQGVHRVECGSNTLILVRLPKTAYLKNTDIRPDILIDDSLENIGSLKRWGVKGALLLLAEPPDPVPPFLIQKGEGYGWRHVQIHCSSSKETAKEKVLVIGAGLAGSMVSWELSKRGYRPIVVDAGMVAGSAASALYAGLIHPHWQASDSPVFQLTRLGFSAMLPLLERFPETFEPQGVIDAASSQEEYERWEEAFARHLPIEMSPDFARLLSREEASGYTGLELSRGGWLFPRAGLVHAGMLCRRLIAESRAQFIPNTRVRLVRDSQGWRAVNDWGVTIATADKAVVSAALQSADVLSIPREWLGMSGLYGRISLLRDTDLPELKTALTGDGYVAKTNDGFTAVGATYEQGEERIVPVEDAHKHNLSTFPKLTGGLPAVVARGFYEGVRAVALDRMPLVGRGFTAREVENLSFKGRPEPKDIPRAENLWICTGLGSRGITWGLACAQAVVADIAKEPSLLTKALKTNLDPARFMPKIFG